MYDQPDQDNRLAHSKSGLVPSQSPVGLVSGALGGVIVAHLVEPFMCVSFGGLADVGVVNSCLEATRDPVAVFAIYEDAFNFAEHPLYCGLSHRCRTYWIVLM